MSSDFLDAKGFVFLFFFFFFRICALTGVKLLNFDQYSFKNVVVIVSL